MARPKSEDKRKAILDAAAMVFAERGVWSTPTSAISRAAGVADGTLFTYFATKEVLVNALYRAIKEDLAKVMMDTCPMSASFQAIFFHVWESYVQWGIANPARYKVLVQLQVSNQISTESRLIGAAPFVQIEQFANLSRERDGMRQYPVAFVGALFSSIADTTIAAMVRDPGGDVDYCRLGFDAFWRGVMVAE
ncbi:TetR/AcrR family transcriptional regulator [Chloroflexia bacterium SDU3-3]|nr:TetR/AcrR family transcriptional regulator [Chloroflexia bacterium SDU3-3]